MKLCSAHDINVVKFYPYNGNFISGGSIGGQIVVWDLQTEWDKVENFKPIKDENWISNFMVSFNLRKTTVY